MRRLAVVASLLVPAAVFAAPGASAPAPSDGAPVPGVRAQDARTPRYEVYLDPYAGAESGSRDLASLAGLLGAGETALFRAGGVAGEGGSGGPAASGAGVVLRSLRTLVWDAPVAWWFGVALHEAFGHGGRGREFNTSPGFHLGSPWSGRTSYASFDAAGTSTEARLLIYAGGTEANGLTATLLERRAVQAVRMPAIELLFLAANRFVASDYVLRTTPDPGRDPAGFYREYAGGGDVAHYLGLLHELYGAGSGITASGADDAVRREYRRLRRQAFWNALDPGAWWAIGSALRMAARGDTAAPLPLPRLGRARFLPILSTEWTPSGGEISLECAVAWPRRPAAAPGPEEWRGLSLVARRGRGPAGGFGALGAAADDWILTRRLGLGGMAEVWRDPRHGLGGGARLRLRLRRGSWRGLFVDLGVKSQGYWVGQPERPGPYGAFGVVWGP